jgi:hypothetical protein
MCFSERIIGADLRQRRCPFVTVVDESKICLPICFSRELVALKAASAIGKSRRYEGRIDDFPQP